MHIVTVLFTVDTPHWDEFLKAMLLNAQTSLALEAGCRQFDVCVGEPGQNTVFLYEVYDTQADFKAHLAADHFLQFNARTLPWVAGKQVRTFTRHAQDPDFLKTAS